MALTAGEPAGGRTVADDIWLIHAESSGTYGSPRVHATLLRQGRRIGVTPEELKPAALKVGVMAKDVEAELRRSKDR